MKTLTSHNYRLEEISSLRTYNSKSFRTPKTNERVVFGYLGNYTEFSGEIVTEFHVKPIHYVGQDGKWHNLGEIASYFGNKNGMILKEGWEDKVDFGWLVWYMKRQKLISGGRGIRIGVPSYPFKTFTIPMILNTVTTAYPDPNPETTSVDGQAFDDGVDKTWAQIHDALDVNSASDTGASGNIGYIQCHATTNPNFRLLVRAFYLFDTSSIPDGDTISAATFSISVNAKNTIGGGNSPTYNVYASTPASNTAIVTSDYDQVGTTAYATAITHANISTSGYNDWTFNATGLANISKTGITKTCVREAVYDAANVAPTWGANIFAGGFDGIFADTADTTSDPKLVVTHAATSIKTFDGLATASVNMVDGLAIASVKTKNGLV